MMEMKANNNGPRIDLSAESQDESDTDRYGVGNVYKLTENYYSYFKNIKIKGYDTTDALPKELKFTYLDIFGIVISIFSFILDMGLDIYLAYTYSLNEDKLYFNLTLAFIAIPSLAMTGFSLRWYLEDADNKKLPPVSPCRWIIRVVFLLLQMGPILRYIDSLYYGLKSNKYKSNHQLQVVYYKLMIYEDADATLLRLFECFLEAAPQLLLQSYIFAQPNNDFYVSHSILGVLQLLSMFSSLFSMSWALASHHRALRYSLDEKLNMTWCGSIAQILWRFFDISSRVMALGLFAAMFPLYFTIFCAMHYAIMVAWILIMRTTLCEDRCKEFIYNAVLGVIFIFCYFNPKDNPTRQRYTFFYVLMFLENTALMIVWSMYSSSKMSFKYSAIILQFTAFVIGISIMIIYYMILHPKKNFSFWAYWTKSKDCNSKEVTLAVTPSENIS